MSETPYFFLVIVAEPQPWPYYAEIPYAAWPDEAMYYNSNGACAQPYDRNWSFLNVMNWDTYENLIVWNAQVFSPDREEQARLGLTEWLSILEGENILSPAPAGRLGFYLLDNIPAEYRKAGNVIVASYNCNRPEVTASVVRLFMQRLQANAAWDGQTKKIMTLAEVEHSYLREFPVQESSRLVDEVKALFSKGEAWHRAHPDEEIDWWKTLDEVREYLRDKTEG